MPAEDSRLRAQFLDAQLDRLDELIVPLVTARAPGLLSLYGVGPDTAARLLIAAGDHPGRLRSEAAWAHLCAAASIPASSGKVKRHRITLRDDRRVSFISLTGFPGGRQQGSSQRSLVARSDTL